MKSKFMQTIGRTFLALLMLFGFTQISVSGQESETGDLQKEQAERSRQCIVGAWRTAVTQRNCQTGLPLAPASRGLLTFNEALRHQERVPLARHLVPNFQSGAPN